MNFFFSFGLKTEIYLGSIINHWWIEVFKFFRSCLNIVNHSESDPFKVLENHFMGKSCLHSNQNSVSGNINILLTICCVASQSCTREITKHYNELRGHVVLVSVFWDTVTTLSINSGPLDNKKILVEYSRQKCIHDIFGQSPKCFFFRVQS